MADLEQDLQKQIQLQALRKQKEKVLNLTKNSISGVGSASMPTPDILGLSMSKMTVDQQAAMQAQVQSEL
jgi:hypothetical protein